MPYSPQTWIDGNTSFPLSAARLSNIETGIQQAASVADQGHRILTTAQRDALGVVTTGTTIYNTTTGNVEIYSGAAWVTAEQMSAWSTYTPTLTNTTAPVTSARFAREGRVVHFAVVLTLTGAQVTGLIGITLPVAAVSVNTGDFTALLIDASPIATFVGVAILGTTSRVDISAENAAGTYTSTTAPSATIPFTWATGDVIRLSGTYEAA